MARPQKFRLSPDDVLDPQNARKLAGHVAEIELWREQIKTLQDNIADVYDAADADGFDNKFIRKIVAIRAKDETARKNEEQGIDAYSQALEIGFRSRARVENPDHDPETGEIIEPQSGLRAEPAAQTVQPIAAVVTSETLTESVESRVGGESDGKSLPVPNTEPETGVSSSPSVSEAGDRDSARPSKSAVPVVPSNVTTLRTHNPATHFLSSEGLARLHGCLKPELCGSSQPRLKLCFNCSVQHDGPSPQVEVG